MMRVGSFSFLLAGAAVAALLAGSAAIGGELAPGDVKTVPSTTPQANVASPAAQKSAALIAPDDVTTATIVKPATPPAAPAAVAPVTAAVSTPTAVPTPAVETSTVGSPSAVAPSSIAPTAPAVSEPVKAEKPAAPQKDAKGKDLDPEPDAPIVAPPVVTETPAAPSNPLATAPATATLAPLNAAIKSALEKRQAVEFHGADAGGRRKQRDAIAAFYAARDFAPVWSANGAAAPATASVLARLAHADEDALVIPAVPTALVTSGSNDEIAESELALSEAVATYAREATGSRIDPRTIAPLIGYKPAIADVADVLKDVPAAGTEAGDKLHAFNPSEPRYIALRKKLAEMRGARTPETASRIPAGPDLRIGMSDPRVPLIRARFSLDGTPDGATQNLRYDTKVAAAVAGFQKANGLPASGILTKRTVVALAGGQPSRLEGELVANMEMWRWLPRDLGQDRIEVNVPDFTVTVYNDNAPVSSNRVVVGKTKTPTPLFSNTMKYLIVNPVWNVPDSIIKKEMMPHLAGDPGYLSRHGYSVSTHNGRLVVKQPSGARNALGRIKFLFPNDYAVYLHDTPSKSLFGAKARAFSHGCVRVDDPFRFGASVLGAGKGWSEKRLLGMLGDKERYVNLPKPLPIYIAYFTVSVDEIGEVTTRDDVYDYVHKVAAALGHEG